MTEKSFNFNLSDLFEVVVGFVKSNTNTLYVYRDPETNSMKSSKYLPQKRFISKNGQRLDSLLILVCTKKDIFVKKCQNINNSNIYQIIVSTKAINSVSPQYIYMILKGKSDISQSKFNDIISDVSSLLINPDAIDKDKICVSKHLLIKITEYIRQKANELGDIQLSDQAQLLLNNINNDDGDDNVVDPDNPNNLDSPNNTDDTNIYIEQQPRNIEIPTPDLSLKEDTRESQEDISEKVYSDASEMAHQDDNNDDLKQKIQKLLKDNDFVLLLSQKTKSQLGINDVDINIKTIVLPKLNIRFLNKGQFMSIMYYVLSRLGTKKKLIGSVIFIDASQMNEQASLQIINNADKFENIIYNVYRLEAKAIVV